MLVQEKTWVNIASFMALFFLISFPLVVYSNKSISGFAIDDTKKHSIATGVRIGNQRVTGIARIVTTASDCSKVESGDIIVAYATDDLWVSSMKRCAGIITDCGGEYSHAALFGKKHGIPVLVGVGNATSLIDDGDIITLDCSCGHVGYVYQASQEDLPARFAAKVRHNDCVISSQLSVPVHGNSGYHYNQPSYHYYSCEIGQAKNDQFQDVESEKKSYITNQVFNHHMPIFIKEVLSTKSKLWWGRKTGTVEIGAKATGCDEFSIKCIPLADDFFALSEGDIKSIIRLLPVHYLGYIDRLIEKCNHKPENMNHMNWVSRVVHKEHVKKIMLPEDVKPEDLIENPTLYKAIIDQKKVDKKERHMLIAAGLFARYWIENKCVVKL